MRLQYTHDVGLTGEVETGMKSLTFWDFFIFLMENKIKTLDPTVCLTEWQKLQVCMSNKVIYHQYFFYHFWTVKTSKGPNKLLIVTIKVNKSHSTDAGFFTQTPVKHEKKEEVVLPRLSQLLAAVGDTVFLHLLL